MAGGLSAPAAVGSRVNVEGQCPMRRRPNREREGETSPRCPHDPAWPGVAVLVGSSDASVCALLLAIDSAQESHSRLTVICVMPKPSTVISVFGNFAGITPLGLEADFYEFASKRVRDLAAIVPDDLPCATYTGCGRPIAEIRSILRETRTGVLLVTQGALSGLSMRRLRRSLSGDASLRVVSAARAQRKDASPGLTWTGR
jgi:hypothetical protein